MKKREAIECFKKILEYEPQNYLAWHNMGRVYQFYDDKKSLECFEKAQKIGYPEGIKTYVEYIKKQNSKVRNEEQKRLPEIGGVVQGDSFTLRGNPTTWYNFPEIQLIYLFIIRKKIAEDPIKIEKIASRRPEIPKKCFQDLFYVDVSQLTHYDISKIYGGNWDSQYLGHFNKIVFEKYFMIREIAKEDSKYISEREWRIFRFAYIRDIILNLNKLKDHQRKLNNGRYYLVYNNFWKGVEPTIYDRYFTQSFHFDFDVSKEFEWDPYVKLLSKPDLLLPEIDLLYIRGHLHHDCPWDHPGNEIFVEDFYKNKFDVWPVIDEFNPLD